MSLLDRALRPHGTDSTGRQGPRAGEAADAAPALSPWAVRSRGAGAGAFAVGSTLVALCLPVLLAWVATADSTAGWGSAVGVAAAAWLVSAGVPVHVGSGAWAATVSFAPLLVTAAQVVVAALSARYALRRLGPGPLHRLSRGRLRRAVLDCGAGFVLAYALLGGSLALVVRAAGVHASLPAALACAAGWALPAFAVAALRTHGSELFPGGVVAGRRVPGYLLRSLGPGLLVAGGLVGAGALAVLVAVGLHLPRVEALSSSLGGGVAGQGVLALLQLLALPNLAMCALSFGSGPGFAVVSGTSITWSASHPGLLPVVPVLGALPDPGPLPHGLRAVALVPALAGVVLAWLAQRRLSALTSWRFRAEVTASAVVVCAAALTVLAWLSAGSLGAARLSSVGPPALAFGGAVLAELAVGAALGWAVFGWRGHRRLREAPTASARTSR